VAQSVEAQRYERKDRGFDFRWGHWDLSLAKSFRSHYGTGVDTANWEPQPPAAPKTCPGQYRDHVTFTFTFIVTLCGLERCLKNSRQLTQLIMSLLNHCLALDVRLWFIAQFDVINFVSVIYDIRLTEKRS
jgi:hypothetical protein